MDRRMLLHVYVVLQLAYAVTALNTKIFGNGSEYLYPCRCANNATCDAVTGACPDGECASLLPQGYGWKGPACQVGNLALNRPVESNTIVDENHNRYNKPHLWHDHDFTVDGSTSKDIFGGSCNVIYTATKAELAFWMVDLEDVYRIWNITLLNTANNMDSSYLEKFDITVGNTTDRSEHERCLRRESRIAKSATTTLNCDTMKVGRYVAISKYYERNKVGRLPLCEVIITGQKWVKVDWKWCVDDEQDQLWCRSCYGDMSPTCLTAPCADGNYGISCSGVCGQCEDNVTCDAHTGHCDRCQVGWKPPLCQEKCNPGTFGFHCLNKCGNCNGYCDAVAGRCPHGCQLWYLNDDCAYNIPIVNLDYVDDFLSLFERQTSVILHLPFPESAMDDYHRVHVEFLHEHNPLDSYTEHDDITLRYNNATYWLKIQVNGLQHNTQYWFRVYVTRTHRNVTEKGKPTKAIRVATRDNGNQRLLTKPADVTTPATRSQPLTNDVTRNDRNRSGGGSGIDVTALAASLSTIGALAMMALVVAAALYFRKRNAATFIFGRYVQQDGIENRSFAEAVEDKDVETAGVGQGHTSHSNIYSVLSN